MSVEDERVKCYISLLMDDATRLDANGGVSSDGRPYANVTIGYTLSLHFSGEAQMDALITAVEYARRQMRRSVSAHEQKRQQPPVQQLSLEDAPVDAPTTE